MNLKDRRIFRRILKQNNCLTSFKQQKGSWNKNLKEVDSLVSGLDFSATKEGFYFWSKICNELPNNIGWNILNEK